MLGFVTDFCWDSSCQDGNILSVFWINICVEVVINLETNQPSFAFGMGRVERSQRVEKNQQLIWRWAVREWRRNIKQRWINSDNWARQSGDAVAHVRLSLVNGGMRETF